VLLITHARPSRWCTQLRCIPSASSVPTSHFMLVAVLSTATSMKCQVGSLPAPCHPEAAAEGSPCVRLYPAGGDASLRLSVSTSMTCQVGSLPAPCHPLPRGRPRSRRISLRSTVSSHGRFLAAARNDNERWRLSHHSTGHITLVEALSTTDGGGGCRATLHDISCQSMQSATEMRRSCSYARRDG